MYLIFLMVFTNSSAVPSKYENAFGVVSLEPTSLEIFTFVTVSIEYSAIKFYTSSILA